MVDDTGVVVYADNGIFMSCKPGVPEASQRAAQKALESYGLTVHNIVPESDHVVGLGLELSGHQCHISQER